jgi:Spy/CpxP family protein refolding chaperone
MNRLLKHGKLVGAILLVFIAGLIGGSLGTLALLKKKILQTRETTYLSERWLTRMESRLDLTQEQILQIKPVVESTLADVQRKRLRVWAEVKELFQSADQEILSKLTPDQQKKYETLKAQREQKIQHWLGSKSN